MRTIKFRGKRINRNGEWAYGDLRILSDRILILPQGSYDAAIDRDTVDPDTVGLFTGVWDENRERIFEGDIICLYDDGPHYLEVLWLVDKACFGVKWLNREPQFESGRTLGEFIKEFESYCSITIAGNIYDNPELIKGDIQ